MRVDEVPVMPMKDVGSLVWLGEAELPALRWPEATEGKVFIWEWDEYKLGEDCLHLFVPMPTRS